MHDNNNIKLILYLNCIPNNLSISIPIYYYFQKVCHYKFCEADRLAIIYNILFFYFWCVLVCVWCFYINKQTEKEIAIK